MSVKFKFTMSDIDAENLFACVSQEINRMNDRIMGAMAGEEGSMVNLKWYRKRIKYLKDLKLKMKFVQVPGGR